MKFLIDGQLPRRLANALNDLGHDAIHTLELFRTHLDEIEQASPTTATSN